MKRSETLFAEASEMRAKADDLGRQAAEARKEELAAIPLAERLVYAAHARCPCGAGMAYDPIGEDKGSPFVGPLSGYWDCSAILLGAADTAVKHEARLPFAFYEIKSELQPSANGATTRPKA